MHQDYSHALVFQNATVFCAEPEPDELQRSLSEKGIKHIKVRVKHPQLNGKVERLFATLRIFPLGIACFAIG